MTTSRKTIKYLKDISLFKNSDEESVKYDSILQMGGCNGKSIFLKIKSSATDGSDANKTKLPTRWLSKTPVVYNEIICSEAYRILLGNDFSPKYRIGVANTPMVMSKLLPNFTPWLSLLRTMPDLTADEVSKLTYKGNLQSEYGKKTAKYLKTTSELDNFNRMVAVSLLFGKDDLHGGNWGIVDVDGKKYAATVDHGQALKPNFCIYSLLKRFGHRKEQFVTTDFIATCREVVADFELKKTVIEDVMAACIDELTVKFWDVPSIRGVMATLEHNKTLLSNLSYQIEAELAIIHGDCTTLRTALLNLPTSYFPDGENVKFGSPIISMQNYRDGYVTPSRISLRQFIQARTDCNCDNHCYCLSPEDEKVESELLAVYDDVLKEKHYVPTSAFSNAR